MPTELDLNSLYKVLKDETRKKVILALHEKCSLSYTDLMAIVNIDSTGKLNYHLKVLNGLISKGKDTKYSLTEKGQLAYRLLMDFPEVKEITKTEIKRVAIIALLGQVAILTSIVLLYTFGYIDFTGLIRAVVPAIFALAIAYVSLRFYGAIRPGTRGYHAATGLMYTLGGGCIGGFVTFFVGGLLINLISKILNVPPLLGGDWGTPFFAVAFVIAPIIGGLLGYKYGKKQGFKKA